jgi:glycosyltransferase involved in cell wall biosynthesis
MHDLTCIVHNFNRANFLKKCLNSIFNQDTKYRFQIIVIDDCSTDGSEGVALKISKKFPMVPFNFFKTEKNTGIGKKAAISLKSEIDEIFHCKYFMRIDSDDFINDSDKFEQQLSILERNNDCVACCHPFYISDIAMNKTTLCEELIQGKFDLPEIISLIGEKYTYAHTSTYIYRNIYGTYLPSEFEKKGIYGDVLFNWIMLKHGSVIYTTKPMTTYTVHEIGSWSSHSDFMKRILELRAEFNLLRILPLKISKLYFSKKCKNLIKRIRSKWM